LQELNEKKVLFFIYLFLSVHLFLKLKKETITKSFRKKKRKKPGKSLPSFFNISSFYFWIDVTTPEPTVRPPSRIEKRVPSSIAIGEISSTSISMLSPGITISTPSGN